MAGLTETSTNFDLEHVKPFLLRVSSLAEGLGPADINSLAKRVSAMPPDAEDSWDFEVIHRGVQTPLHIRVFMDDIDAPDVYFFTSPELAEAITDEMSAFFDELEM